MHTYTTSQTAHANPRIAAFAAQNLADLRAQAGRCGGCGGDEIVLESEARVICPCCAAEAWANR